MVYQSHHSEAQKGGTFVAPKIPEFFANKTGATSFRGAVETACCQPIPNDGIRRHRTQRPTFSPVGGEKTAGRNGERERAIVSVASLGIARAKPE